MYDISMHCRHDTREARIGSRRTYGCRDAESLLEFLCDDFIRVLITREWIVESSKEAHKRMQKVSEKYLVEI